MMGADTSFLISLYGSDVNRAAAQAHIAKRTDPIEVHDLNDFEFGNTLRLLVFRQKITPASRESQLKADEADKQAGLLRLHALDAGQVLDAAAIISSARTEGGGHRGYDILHVAAAKWLGATDF